ncbi:MAG: maleylpyruvate isomerase family mycothiol-dependent enzyme [Actinobacteria bacterium]|nr:maleylpyruvate isomerase family mycothiol-dependent enzyme [Actinomycetota bacterium]
MTERKDFKRIVRARARRTGESYSSALRNVRNAHHAAGSHEEVRPIAIKRTIPDIRSTKIESTTRFYTELLGFDTRITDGRVVAFVSPTDAAVEVTLNRDGFTLPPGFTVEVESVDSVSLLYERRHAGHVRMIEELKLDGSQFSVLDPSGRRVTVAAGGDQAPITLGDVSRSINRVIPGVTTNDPDATRRFYVEYLGLDLVRDHDGIMMFRSPAAPGAQVIASVRQANPDGFDLVVGSLDRLDEIHRAAQSRSIVLHALADFPEHGIRCFMVFDPNGIGVNVAAILGSSSNTATTGASGEARFRSELAKTYDRRAEAFEALILATPPERWASPSPCEGWLARDVVSHVVDFSAHVLRDKGFEDPPRHADFDGELIAFRATREFVVGVLDDPSTPPKVASFIHWSLSFDLPQHGWDLAVATGQDPTMDADEVELLWGSLNGDPANWEWQRTNGWYGTPVAVPEDARLQDRVLGLLGRNPYWTA